jgi:hypothetical protein
LRGGFSLNELFTKNIIKAALFGLIFVKRKPHCSVVNIILPQPDMIRRRGYKAETHSVTTKDGYVLEMHRIPSDPPRGEPVFLQHGILSSSADWVEMGPDTGLGKKHQFFKYIQK